MDRVLKMRQVAVAVCVLASSGNWIAWAEEPIELARRAEPGKDSVGAPRRSRAVEAFPGRTVRAGAFAASRASETGLAFPGTGMRYVVESRSIAFGDVVPGEPLDIPGAIRVRVFSDRDWHLRLLPVSPLRHLERGLAVPLSRLAWRPSGAGPHHSLSEGAPQTIASGARTSGGGVLVAVDLRLATADGDPLGPYETSFRLELTPN